MYSTHILCLMKFDLFHQAIFIIVDEPPYMYDVFGNVSVMSFSVCKAIPLIYDILY